MQENIIPGATKNTTRNNEKKTVQHSPVKWFSAVDWGVQMNSTNQDVMPAVTGKHFKSAEFSLSCRAISLYSTIF
ncbi:hypothetical protein HX910_003141 [Salmonella enterica]|nr:hypothetical protein [Salmonella enterica]EFP4636068.1 hypothetical protein [Salmonella enterica]EFS0364528.1 hypothetical protein [Salmonella enterica]EGK1506838.1 hypothetical protein [Salmonella enterica]